MEVSERDEIGFVLIARVTCKYKQIFVLSYRISIVLFGDVVSVSIPAFALPLVKFRRIVHGIDQSWFPAVYLSLACKIP